MDCNNASSKSEWSPSTVPPFLHLDEATVWPKEKLEAAVEFLKDAYEKSNVQVRGPQAGVEPDATIAKHERATVPHALGKSSYAPALDLPPAGYVAGLPHVPDQSDPKLESGFD